jgi:uncharacterized protein (TIGR02270 family)
VPDDLVLLDVLEEHLEEFDLLWERRQREIVSPDGRPDSLATLEGRMAAHLEGLRIGGAHSLAIARRVLPEAKGSTAFAAAYSLLALGGEPEERAVLEALAAADADAAEGLRHALRHRAGERLLGILPRILSGPDSPASVAALDGLAFHRRPAAVDLAAHLAHEDPWVRQVAWSAVGRLRPPLSATSLAAGFEDLAPHVARSAFEAVCWMGRREVLEACRAGSRRATNADRWAVAMLGVLGEAEDAAALITASQREPVRDAAMVGLGYLGDPAGIERTLEAMADPLLIVAAGEAFRQITGADIDAREEPRDSQTPERPVGDPAEFLPERPTPDPERATAFWNRKGSEFRAGQRYRFGVLLDVESVPGDLQGRRQATLRAAVARAAAIPAAEDPERFELR